MTYPMLQEFFESRGKTRTLWESLFAAGIVLVAFALQALLTPHFKNALYLCFYPGILFVAFFTAKFLIGVIATFSSALLIVLFLSPQLLYDPANAPTSWAAIITFISIGVLSSHYQSRAAKHMIELSRKDRELAAVMNNVPSMIAFWDENQRNVYCNKVYTNYFRKGPAEIKGRHIKEILGDKLYADNLPYITKALAGELQIFERDLTFSDGEIHHTLAHYIPNIEAGRARGFFVVVNDISEVKKAEREREQLFKQLIVSEKMSSLGEMAGGIAHEINNPLAIIIGKLDLIERRMSRQAELDCEKLRTDLRKVHTTAKRIERIVKGLRSFSRNAENDPMEQVSLERLITETLSLCQERFRSHGVEIWPRLDPNLTFDGRAIQLSQVLINLLNNSFQAIRCLPKKWIEIRGEIKSSETLRLMVTDSGEGIPPAIAEKIMQPFFTTKDVGEGTGLGLSISKGIIEDHGGRLYLDDSHGHTRFIIELPLKQPSTAPQSLP